MLGDTIYAIASPPGAAARGLIRVSGPAAVKAAQSLVADPLAAARGTLESSVEVLGHRVPCLVLTMPGPHSYTGEDVVELHLPGSPVLLDEVCRGLAADARLATPGEFTRRAFENGRLDLSEAEAVAGLIHAADVAESRFAIDVLRGGLATSVDGMRSGIQDALALLEAGLDFTDGETGSVDAEQWLPPVRLAAERCDALRIGLPRTGVHGEILLLGAANAGKSSLANALVGADTALVAPVPGTTRDVLVFELAPGVRLLDGPGDLPGGDPDGAPDETGEAVDRQAIELRDRVAERAAGVLEVIDLTAPRWPARTAGLPVVARVFTKSDLHPGSAPTPGAGAADGVREFVVSSRSGAGLDELAEFLRAAVSGGPRGLSTRLHDALTEVSEALERARAGAVAGQLEELIALDLAAALAALDSIHGRSTPEDLLDRIFAGFCLGK